MKSITTIKRLWGTLGSLALIFVLGCDGILDGPSKGDKQSDEAALQSLMHEITALSEKGNCEDAASWKFMPIGAKPCGGPAAYVAYSTAIDTNDFIKKVKKYTEATDKFIKKWRPVSDCMVPSRPIGIVCNIDGKPMFNYDHKAILAGIWVLKETRFDPGDGNSKYTPVTGPYKYLHLKADGTVAGKAIPTLVTYVVLDDKRIEFKTIQNENVIFRYTQTGSNLELIPPCIEFCGYKFGRDQ